MVSFHAKRFARERGAGVNHKSNILFNQGLSDYEVYGFDSRLLTEQRDREVKVQLIWFRTTRKDSRGEPGRAVAGTIKSSIKRPTFRRCKAILQD